MHELLEAAGTVLDDVVALRRDLHQNPELGLDNPRTQAMVLAALDGLPVDVRTGDGLTSVVADLTGTTDGPTVLLRADTDALPMTEDTDLDFRSAVDGRAHACGHDAHTAMLVGAAKVLAARRDEVAGRVRFMFQPGEEGFAGAQVMIDEACWTGWTGPSPSTSAQTNGWVPRRAGPDPSWPATPRSPSPSGGVAGTPRPPTTPPTRSRPPRRSSPPSRRR